MPCPDVPCRARLPADDLGKNIVRCRSERGIRRQQPHRCARWASALSIVAVDLTDCARVALKTLSRSGCLQEAEVHVKALSIHGHYVIIEFDDPVRGRSPFETMLRLPSAHDGSPYIPVQFGAPGIEVAGETLASAIEHMLLEEELTLYEPGGILRGDSDEKVGPPRHEVAPMAGDDGAGSAGSADV